MPVNMPERVRFASGQEKVMAQTFADSKIFIGTTAPIDYTTDEQAVADFEADDFTEILEMSNLGDIGPVANILQFVTVSGNRTKKSKGQLNEGDPVLVVGREANDPGQVLVRAAGKDKYYRNFKLELADAESEHYTNSVIYFRAIVSGAPRQFGGNESFMTESYTLGIYPQAIEVPSEFVTSPSP
jgi:hypothetical protein